MPPHRNIERSDPLPSTFEHPPIHVTTASLEAHFARPGREPQPIRNPHGWAREPINASGLRHAAVLVPVVDEPAGLQVLLTRRTSNLRRDPGNMAFPGGSVDPGDASSEAAALRETREEVGLEPERVRVLGRLGDFETQVFRITPFVGIVEPPLALTPNPAEVASVHLVPLDHATRAAAYQKRAMRGGGDGWFYSLEYGDDVYIGGPTVAILIGLYEALLETHTP